MRRVRCFPKWLSLVSGLVLAMGVAACGDDDAADPDARPPAPDAPVTPPDDAGPDAMPDAMPPQSTHAGAISVTEVSVPQFPGGLSGGSVLVEFEQLGTGTAPAVAYSDVVDGTPPVGCVVFVHDPADTDPTTTDEGTVTITGTQSPLGPCSYTPTSETESEYVCGFGMHAIATGDTLCEAGNALCDMIPAGTARLVVAGANFDAASQSERGMYVSIGGGGVTFPEGAYAIVGVLSQTALLIGKPDGEAGIFTATDVGAAVVISGAGPTPANVNFLDDGSSGALSITKEAGTNVEAFTVTGEVKPAGEGLAFKPGSDTPMAMPTDGSAAEFNCTGPDDTGTCGAKPIGGIPLTLINGSTTNEPVTGAPPYYFPKPTGKYATFLCTFTQVDVDVTIPAGAMEAILGTVTGFEHSPTRIETRVFKMNGTIRTNEDGTNQTRIVSGHGIVGYTDVPQD